MDLGIIWFVLIGVLLVGYAVLDGFDLGVGILSPVVGRGAKQRAMLMEAIGPVWDGNEVWLLTMGGALFAAFPIVYATVFSGYYLALMLLLFALIMRAVAMEFRHHIEEPRWLAVWDGAFFLGSLLTALLLGVAIGNIARGLPLVDGQYTGGLLGLLNPFSLLVGLMAVIMFIVQGAAWLVLRTEGEVYERARRSGTIAWIAFVVLWLAVTAYSLVEAPDLWGAYSNPLTWIVPVLLVLAIGLTGYALRAKSDKLPILASSASIASLVAILGLGIYPALVPDRNGGEGLTVANSASSDLTLTVMLIIVLIGVPLVLLYTAFVYRHFSGKVDTTDTYA